VDRSAARDPFSRPVVSAAAASLVIGCGYLISVGAMSHAPNPYFYVAEDDPPPIRLAGALLFEEQGCEWCHSVLGRGGRSAPDLWRVGERRDRQWLRQLFRSPDTVLPAGSMPRYDLPERELGALVNYVAGLDFARRRPVRLSREIGRGGGEVYRSGCLECHGDQALDVSAPPFAGIGQRRSADWITRYVSDPAFHEALAPGASGLARARREEIAAYLTRQ
jgi:cbb3-type cytochrome oxidase cytochrome c subunit